MYRKTAARSCAQGVISPPPLNTGQVEPSRNSYTESKEVESRTLCALKFKLKPPGIQTRRLGSVRGHSPPSLSALCPWLPFSVPSCPPSLNSLPGCSLHTSPSMLASLPPLSLPHPCTVSKLPKPTLKTKAGIDSLRSTARPVYSTEPEFCPATHCPGRLWLWFSFVP